MVGRRRMLAVGVVVFAICAAVPAAPAAAASRIYWSNTGGGRISYANLDGSGGANLSTSGATGGVGFDFFGIAIDIANGRLYWADTNFGHPNESTISYANLDGSGGGDVETGAAAVEEPLGVAIDPTANRVYWANAFGNKISYANLDGSGGANLGTVGATVSEPTGVAIDPATGRIYWANAAANNFGWAALDGSGGGTIEITGPATVNKPEGVAVDPAAQRIYWANRGANKISWANLDGSGGEDVATGSATVSEPVGVAVDPAAGRIYWGNFSGGVDKKISWAALDGSGGEDLSIAGATETGAFTFPALLETPSGTVAPTVSGASTTGSTLACSQGAWAADLSSDFLFQAPRSFGYTWQLNGADLPGASGATIAATQPGSYSCRVTATNPAGSSAQTSAGLMISAPPPPAVGPEPPDTKITKAKVNSAKHRATFRFVAVGRETSFQCKLRAHQRHSKARFRPCTSPKTYPRLKPGKYTFEVRAVGPGGIDRTPATRGIVVKSIG
jgi:DNA-binding beta-propeller fold protein YncE